MLVDEKIMVKESAEKMVDAINKCVEAVGASCTLESVVDMDPKTLVLIQASMKIVTALNDLTVQSARAIDDLTNTISEMNKKMDYMNAKIDELSKKSI